MSISLDGFVAAPDDGPGAGLGRDGEVLHAWMGPRFAPPGVSGQVLHELMTTGAILVGRKMFEYADQWGGDHHGVLARPRAGPSLAGLRGIGCRPDRAVGRTTTRAPCGPVLLWPGRRRGAPIPRVGGQQRRCSTQRRAGRAELGVRCDLEQTRVLVADDVTHLHYRVVR